MSEALVVTEAEAIELFAFLITSARTQLDEPCQYASMRVLTAAEILRDYMMARVTPDTRALLEETVETTTHAHINMVDKEIYAATLDKLCRRVAEFVVKQSGLSKSGS
jgi:hypothetical protein